MQERFKVLFLATWYPHEDNWLDGIFVREHAKAVTLYDDVVVINIPGPSNIPHKIWYTEKVVDENLSGGIETYRSRFRKLPVGSFFVQQFSLLQAFRNLLHRGFKPDIIHANVYSSGISAIHLSRYYKIPYVISEHSSSFPRKLLTAKQLRLAKISFKWARLVLPVSDVLRKGIEDYGIQAHFKIVPNAIDTRIFHPGDKKASSDSGTRLLFVGSLIPVKGVANLLQAVASLNQGNWRLDIVGDGLEGSQYRQMAVDLNIAERVIFHGRLPKAQVASLMQNADLFVLPSRWENQPCVINEALSCGLPVLASNVGGIPETIGPHAGLLVPAEDITALADGILKVITGQVVFDQQEISRQAARYSMEDVGRQFHEIYRGIIARWL